jgi:predicted TIM-barrel fold metal-dependent hydrolase
MVIDSHLHVWSNEPDRYPWAGKGTTEAGSVELLLETMGKSDVDKAVIVQPIHYLYDNTYVADCLKQYPGKFSAMAIMDRHRPDAVEHLVKLVTEDGFEGLRMHLGRPDDPTEWAAPDQDPIWRKAEELGASFLSFGPAEKQSAVQPIIARCPGVKVILDHLGGAPIDEEPPYPRLNHVLNLASYPNVYVKFTPQAGLSNEDFPLADTHATYERIYDAFGPQRLMWGTDFPHILRNIGYENGLALFRDHLPFLNDNDKEWLLSKTALSIWKFGEK